jgi:hypothetical protein
MMTEEELTVELRNFISKQKQIASDLSKQVEDIREQIKARQGAIYAASDLLPIVGYPDIVREQLNHIRSRLSERGLDLPLTELWAWLNKHTNTTTAPTSPPSAPFPSEALLSWQK